MLKKQTQFKPNLPDTKMNVNTVLTKEYENSRLHRHAENKPNQTQSNGFFKAGSPPSSIVELSSAASDKAGGPDRAKYCNSCLTNPQIAPIKNIGAGYRRQARADCGGWLLRNEKAQIVPEKKYTKGLADE